MECDIPFYGTEVEGASGVASRGMRLSRSIGTYRPQATFSDGRSDGKKEATTNEVLHIHPLMRAGDN